MRTLWSVVTIAASGCGSPQNEPADACSSDAPVVDGAADAQTCVGTPNGLRARYRAENNTNDHAGMFNGTSAGSQPVTYASGRYGMAFQLDGLNNIVTIADDDLLWPSFSLTLEAWVQTTSTFGGMVICKFECGGTTCTTNATPYFCLGLDASMPVFEFKAGQPTAPSKLTATSSPVNDGKWHHLVAVRDGTTKTASLYVDGLLAIASNPPEEQFGPMTNGDGEVDVVTIGGRATLQPDYFEYRLAARIDEVAIYHQPVTAAQVSAIYNAPDGKCL